MRRAISEFFNVGPGPRGGSDARRIGVIDMGSNSVRLVVFESATRTPDVFFNEKALCGLGADLASTGRLSPDGKERARAALARFSELAKGMALAGVEVVATAALRDAEDGPAFAAEIERETGFTVRIASGADEARLAAQGVMLGDPGADGVAADMGGASLELVRLSGGEVSFAETTPLGPLRLAAAAQEGVKAVDKVVAQELDAAIKRQPGLAETATLYALGGSWRAVVKAHMERTDYPMRVLHGYMIDREAAEEAAAWVAGLTTMELREIAGVSERRAKVTPLAAQVLLGLLKRLRPDVMRLSAFGLREGVLWESMPHALRAADPLIEAARELEGRHARAPGLGDEIWRFVSPVAAFHRPEDRRLAEAVCLLSDVSWRTHPDYRGSASFELVTRNVYGGVDHSDRAYMGLALLYRHKAARRGPLARLAEELLTPERIAEARALGKLLRLASALAGAALGKLPGCRASRRAPPPDLDAALEGLHGGAEEGPEDAGFGDTSALVLTVPPDAGRLLGEAVEKAAAAAADALELGGVVIEAAPRA